MITDLKDKMATVPKRFSSLLDRFILRLCSPLDAWVYCDACEHDEFA